MTTNDQSRHVEPQPRSIPADPRADLCADSLEEIGDLLTCAHGAGIPKIAVLATPARIQALRFAVELLRAGTVARDAERGSDALCGARALPNAPADNRDLGDDSE